MTEGGFKEIIFEYIDKAKNIFSAQIWNNVLMNCSKNEVLALFYVYRRGEVMMSQLAEYLDAPLNTVTGVVGRMEKRDLVVRSRSLADKRVVTVSITEAGKKCFADIMRELMYYLQIVMNELSPDELQTLLTLMDKITGLFEKAQVQRRTQEKPETIKKIRID